MNKQQGGHQHRHCGIFAGKTTDGGDDGILGHVDDPIAETKHGEHQNGASDIISRYTEDMEIPLPQDKLLQQLETAIEQRDLHAIKSLSPRINWMHQYRRDAVATEKDFFTYQRQALLALFLSLIHI